MQQNELREENEILLETQCVLIPEVIHCKHEDIVETVATLGGVGRGCVGQKTSFCRRSGKGRVGKNISQLIKTNHETLKIRELHSDTATGCFVRDGKIQLTGRSKLQLIIDAQQIREVKEKKEKSLFL